MKKYNLATGVIFFFLFLVSCEEDPCINRNCGDHGVCVAISDVAVCECDEGWEKDNNERCNNFKLDNFTGSFSVSETCTDDLTNQQVSRDYLINMSIISQLNNEVVLTGLNEQSCMGQPLAIEAVVSNTAFAFKTGDYCLTSQSRIVIPSGNGTWQEDGTYDLSYSLQYYELGTILTSEVCTATLSPQ